jgi:hypothetical protein
MSAQLIGWVKSPKTFKSYEVRWNTHDRNVYVNYAGNTKVGKASSATQAMNVAEAWLSNK